MTQLFVFTAGNSEARQHLEDSIKSPIEDEVVFGNFDEAHHEELERIKREGNGFYAWGAVPGVRNIPTWKQMKRGDFVLCVYDSAYRYVSRVLAKYGNAECAETIWGTNADGQTWQYMYFLTEPIETYQPLYEFDSYLYSRYQGFTRISDSRLEEIEDNYGSLETFIGEICEGEVPDLPMSPSEEIAETSLEVDNVTYGIQDEDQKPQSEGRKRVVQAVQYERSPKNRKKAIELHGTICTVCEFDFDKIYGQDYAKSYIQIHHVNPVSKYQGEVNPATDLVPLCGNCHAMAHKRRDTVTPIEELRELLEKAKG